jgi:hypothetical protein
MNKSESIENLTAALVQFQSLNLSVKKEAKNPFYGNKYASLSQIIETVQLPLAECGLAVIQLPIGTNQLETILIHQSGEFISECYEMKPSKADPQGLGSAITYQRRYALGAILCLNIDEDDDGNKASAPEANVKPTAKPIERKPISDDSFAKMCDAMRKAETQKAASDIHMKQTKWYTFDDQQTNIIAQIIDGKEAN